MNACASPGAPARLPALTIESVAVSPLDEDLVFVGTTYDRERCNGIYRSADGGETWTRVFPTPTISCPFGAAGYQGGNQPVTELTFAPDDPTKLWASVGCGLAYSTVGTDSPNGPPRASAPSSDVGINWTLLPTPMSLVTHLAVGTYNPAYGASGGRAIWTCAPVATPDGYRTQLWSSEDGGLNFRMAPLNAAGRCNYELAPPAVGNESGEHQLVADDSGAHPAVYLLGPASPSQHALGRPAAGGNPATPGCRECLFGLVSVTRLDGPITTFFFSKRLPGPPKVPDTWVSGEASLYGFYSGQQLEIVLNDTEDFYVADAPPERESSWHRLSGRDADYGCSAMTSVCSSVDTWAPHDLDLHPTTLHDDSHAFAAAPQLTMQLGPSGMLSRSLRPEDCTGLPTDAATMLLSNDGGVAVSNDCGTHWRYGDISNVPAAELFGLARRGRPPALYVGGRDDGNWFSLNGGARWSHGYNDCGDCEGYFGVDGGLARGDPAVVGTIVRSNQTSDTFQACCRWRFWWTTDGSYPDVSGPGSEFELRPYQNYPRMSTDRGWAPVIQPLAGERYPLLPSLTVARATPRLCVSGPTRPCASPVAALYNWLPQRVNLSVDGTSIVETINPIGAAGAVQLPVLQASGGINRTTYYAAVRPASTSTSGDSYINVETTGVYKHENLLRPWVCIVPSGPGCTDPTAGSPGCPPNSACEALKLAVDPYGTGMRQLLYIADKDGSIEESLDAGRSWFTNASLTQWVTDQSRLSQPSCEWVCDWADSDEELHRMLFVPNEPGTAFAVGVEGVFMTLDAGCALTHRTASQCASAQGESWHRLLDPFSTPCQPESLWFDADEPDGRALYVGCSQRGVLKLLGIPRPNLADRARLDQNGLDINAGTSPIHLGFPPQPHRYQPSPPEFSGAGKVGTKTG